VSVALEARAFGLPRKSESPLRHRAGQARARRIALVVERGDDEAVEGE
jgi:hypothetical protein